MWVLTCEHAVRNWLLFRIGRCLLFWSSCSGWPGYKVECKGDFGAQVVHWWCHNYALQVDWRPGKNTSELLQSNLLQVMGVIELKPTLLEGTGDQNREDSGENLNIALMNSRCNYYSCALLFKSHFWHQGWGEVVTVQGWMWRSG